MAVRVDLKGIKEAIQTVLTNANTTTATPIDLSADLTAGTRVREILKVHPEMIVPQASMFPLVTCYIPNKPIKRDDIAKDQLSAKRRATVQVEVVGTIWNDNIVTIDEDPADEDIGYLMENIELILRSDFNLSGKVNWQKPIDCKYYTTILDEQTHLRSGILSLECEVYY
jgi:hypothetical protein